MQSCFPFSVSVLRFPLSVFCFLFSIFCSPFSAFPADPSIRIALLKNVPEVTVEGNELRIQIAEAKPVSYYLDSPARITAVPEGFKVGDEFYAPPLLKIFDLDEKLSLNGKNFEGTLNIAKSEGNKLLVINKLPLEKYLVGLVHGEINASWPREAIKAQVVAGRTYALFRQKKKRGQGNLYDLEATTLDQVYAGSQGEADLPVQTAIAETRGEVLWFLGYYPAYFHSACGGETETVNRVWGKNEMSTSVVDPFCEQSPYRSWEFSLSTRSFLNQLKSHGLEGTHLKSIATEKQDGSPRNVLVTIETNKMTLFLSATDLRRILGYDKLKSTRFEVTASPRWVTFEGTGYGHGVGLCQWGAKAMAESGKTYREILEFYYPKAVIRKIY